MDDHGAEGGGQARVAIEGPEGVRTECRFALLCFALLCPRLARQAYYLLDETIIAGELQETSKQKVLHATVAQDMLIKAANGQDN